jgi:hypothetical protein
MIDPASFSAPIWIVKNGIRNEKSDPIEFKNHLFLFDYLRDTSKNICAKKCAQIGGSVVENLKTFHLAKYRKITTIYTMPSDSDVEEFSKTKTDKIFQANACIRDSLMMDNVFLKQVGNTFLYFKGTRSKAAPISTTADRLVHDEIDRSDLQICDFYQSRIADSEHKMTVLLSNPSVKNVGVDLAWKDSDKKEWFIKCTGCGEKQFLTYEDNIDEIGKRIVCRACNKEFTDKERRAGWWEPTGQFGAKWSGYHFSHLMYIRHAAEEIIEAKEKRGIEYFYNFVLGEPYSAGEMTDFRQAIYDVWIPKSLDTPPFFMGVDVGKEKHWVIGSADGIFKIGKCESREELEAVITRYNPFVVMDSGPERIWAEEFKQKFPKVNLCFYRKDKNVADMVTWGGDKGNFEDSKNWGYLWIDRNRVIDACVYDLQRGNFFFSLNREDLEKFILHCETMRRIPEDVPALHTYRYIWDSTTGVNHWFSALYFWWLAMKRGSMPVELLPDNQVNKNTIIQVVDGKQQMVDLKELIENRIDYGE